ncbi:hypothetical protein ES332_A07G122800v1 [Gossypium tomentosum]|uniref:Uncharacterized protein n=1 Tax=Gossypium tomentosum TaxID=34277 RepID=A0A5D2PV92_GOSTO|nr:hypothetical protein ES332_A07G122800v1 [Gossypium tomentosum]
MNESVLVLENKRVNEGQRVFFITAPFPCAMTCASARFGRPGIRLIGEMGKIPRLSLFLCARFQFSPDSPILFLCAWNGIFPQKVPPLCAASRYAPLLRLNCFILCFLNCSSDLYIFAF